jgi:hypothetical protein
MDQSGQDGQNIAGQDSWDRTTRQDHTVKIGPVIEHFSFIYTYLIVPCTDLSLENQN